MKFLIIIMFLLSGCISVPKIIKSPSSNDKVHSVQFEEIDLDKNGTIDRNEFSAISGKINTESPAWGLFLILIMVVVSTGACSFMLRDKKTGVNK